MKPPKTQKATDDDKWPTLRWKDKKKRWLLDGRLGRGGAKGGRKWWFERKEEAEKKRTELRAEHAVGGSDALAMTPAARIEAQTCSARLAARGKTLTDATTHYIDYLDRSAKPLRWSALVAKIVDDKKRDGFAARYTKDLESRLGMLATDRGDRLVSEYTTAELDAWLREMRVRKPGHKNFGELLGPTSRNNSRRLLVVAFNIAITAGACATNPAEKISIAKPPRPEHDDDDDEDAREVTMRDILLPTELAVLLIVAEPGLLPYLALAAFCGLRRSELSRIAWRRVEWDKSRIYVPGRVGKRASRWVQLRAAYAFLLPYKGRTGLLTPKNFRESLDRARIRAADLLDAHKVEGRLAAWPQNCLRHGFASYHYSNFGDAKGLATEMGHRSTDLIFTTYREPAPRELAERFWSLSPSLIELGRTGGVPAILKALKSIENSPPVKPQDLARESDARNPSALN